MASVALSAFQRQQEKSASVRMIKTSCTTHIPITCTSRATPAAVGDRPLIIRRRLESELAELAVSKEKVNGKHLD